MKEQVYPALLPSACASYEGAMPVEQVLTRGPLLPYLYRHSEDLEDYFTNRIYDGVKLPPLPQLLIERRELQRLLALVDKVPQPDETAEKLRSLRAWEKFAKMAGVFIPSQAPPLPTLSVAKQLADLKALLHLATSRSDLAITAVFE